MRASTVIALLVFACALSVARASSSDWATPEALWAADDLSASELEARHSEFIIMADATGSSSSSGDGNGNGNGSSGNGNGNGSSSSSSGNGNGNGSTGNNGGNGARSSSTGGNGGRNSSSSTGPSVPRTGPALEAKALFNCKPRGENWEAEGQTKANGYCTFDSFSLGNTMKNVFGLADPSAFQSNFVSVQTTVADESSSSSTGVAAARRLLAVIESTSGAFTFSAATQADGARNRRLYAAFCESLACTTAQCRTLVKIKYSLPGDPGADPAFAGMADTLAAGSFDFNADAINEENDAQNAGNREQAAVGGPRDTNGGYYFLGALLLLFIVLALVYMIVHKPAKAKTLEEKQIELQEGVIPPPAAGSPLAAAAPVAASSGVVVAEEERPLASQQQMDYRSVFALKHNVLDKTAEQKAAEEDEHNHNDVHFILHQ